MKAAKNLIALALALILALSLFSCTIKIERDDVTSESTNEIEKPETRPAPVTESETEEETKPDVPESYVYSMNGMPDVKADRIQYLPTDLYQTYFVFQKNGSYGTIDSRGKTISDAKYDNLTYNFSCSIEKYNNIKTVGAYIGDKYYVIDNEGTFIPCEWYGWGIESMAEVYWYNDGPVMFDNWEGEMTYSAKAYCSYAHCRSILGNSLYFVEPRVIAIKELSKYSMKESEFGYMEIEKTFKSDKYALFDVASGKLVTGFDFDETCSDISVNGVMAVKSDGKWAYITEAGTLITDFVYDAPDQIEQYDSEGKPHLVDTLYLPVNGCIVTYTINGGYGLIDTNGETILDNKYQFVSQVNTQGVCWVQSGNSWNVCIISEK